jgi:hypothetical protein
MSIETIPGRTDTQIHTTLHTLGVLVAPLLALTGLLVYALLMITYSAFYGSLGVDPRDIGLGYASVLATSPGLVVWYGALAVPAFFVVITARKWPGYPTRKLVYLPISRGKDDFAPQHLQLEPRVRRLFRAAWVFIFIGCVLLAATLFQFPLEMGSHANAVRQGKPVKPITFGPLVLLPVQAQPVNVEPIDGRPSPSTSRLSKRSLLYLGQSNGTVVFYDYEAQQAVYAPLSTVLINISNCRTKRAVHPACARTFDR